MNKKVFTNRTLNMKKIKYIGLDMDHTLIRYNSENFEKLAYEITREKLTKMFNYPDSVMKLKFDYARAIRGLVIDKNGGNIIKTSRFGAIRQIHHGLKPIDYKSRMKLYENTYIDLSDPSYDTIDTTFSISFATLFAQLVDLKDSSEHTQLPEYNQIAEDILVALDAAHADGSIKDIVRNNLDKYIIKDKKMVDNIKRYKKHGKKVFIITNSGFSYSKALLDYAISPFLDEGETWLDLFEIIITLSKKPRFFYDSLGFLEVNPEDGTMTNKTGPLKKGIYQGGCADVLTKDLDISPNDILYIGDHIYGDVVRLKKTCAWRTGLVVEELSEEIEQNKKAESINEEINELMALKIPLEKKIDAHISQKIENDDNSRQEEIDALISQVNDIDKKISQNIKGQQALYNSHWGEVMRSGIEESYFAYQVERFSDIYMARLSDFFEESPRNYYRSHRRLMAHEEA